MAGLAPAILEAGKSTQFFDQQLMASIATVEEAAIPQLEKLEETFRSVTEAAKIAAEPSKNAPGSVGRESRRRSRSARWASRRR